MSCHVPVLSTHALFIYMMCVFMFVFWFGLLLVQLLKRRSEEKPMVKSQDKVANRDHGECDCTSICVTEGVMV